MTGRTAQARVVTLCLLMAFAAHAAGQARPARTDDQRTERAAERAKQQSREFFARNDHNKDGKLSREEVPEGARRVFDAVDAD
ncbi:MAG: hypothetical protein WBF17_25265, partial [Phycisphaerae bacterium]